MADITEDQARAAERIVAEAIAPELPSELSISELLKNTDAAEDRDHAFIMAYLINLYCEAMKRLQGRTLWKATDGQRLARVMNLIMELNTGEPKLPGKPQR
jgi:hypothetical protein